MKKREEKEQIVLDEEFIILKEIFEDKIGYIIRTEAECELVRDIINEKNPATYKGADGHVLSLKTLKRVFGLLSYEEYPSIKTLTALARGADFKDWDDFLSHLPKIKLSSDNFGLLFNPDNIAASKLKEGQIVTIGWKPIYYCDAKYLGDFKFEIIEGNLQKKKRGDIFRAKKFLVDYTYFGNLDSNQIREGYPYFPRIYLTMNEDAENPV